VNELLTIIVQASLIGWAVLIGALGVGAARRALQARRRRRTYWADLVRHYRTSSALIAARWSDADHAAEDAALAVLNATPGDAAAEYDGRDGWTQ